MYNIDCHVLSNSDIISIIAYSAFGAMILAYVFAALGSRDKSPKYKKGIVGKIVPWILLLIFISDSALIASRLAVYPWEIDPQPSQASAYRELQDMCIGSPVWGWANDYQLDIVGKLGGCVCALCWTVYAFCYKRSNTNWWRKAFKVIAYILLSMLIIGFSYHETKELLVFLVVIIVPSFLFLFFARVKPTKVDVAKATTASTDEKHLNDDIRDTVDINKEDFSRFLPHDINSNDSYGIDNGAETIGKEAPLPQQLPKDEQLLGGAKENTQNCDDMESVEEIEKIDTEQQSNTDTDATKNISDMMFCKYCGKKIEIDSTFCKYCGRKL